MKISKTIYLFVHLLLSVNFWNFVPMSFLSRDILFIMTLGWSIMAIGLYDKPNNLQLNSWKYKIYFYCIAIAIFISTISAYLFWNQSLKVTFIAQRFAYLFVLLLVLLYVQPTIENIVKSLKWISIGTIIMWCVSIFKPQYILTYHEFSDERINNLTTELGFYIEGIEFVTFYLYFIIQKYIQSFSMKYFMQAMILVLFFVMYHNRSMLIGVILILMYSIFQIKSKYKLGLIILTGSFIWAGFIYTSDIWLSYIEKSQEFNDLEYNRWKALFYYFNEYSPNLFCYIFGNGMPSGGKSDFGNLMWENMEMGIYASDLGIIGMWTIYGLIPLIIIYSIIYKVLVNYHFPLMLKFICFHILLVPTIFLFNCNPGIIFFCLIIYLFAYFNEHNKMTACVRNNNCKL